MEIFTSTQQLRDAIKQQKLLGKKIALTPTMGNLHEGHLSLVSAAKEQNSWTVASIFVNPLQFRAGEDLDNYPRTIEEDTRLLQTVNCDALFLPSVSEMYPSGMTDVTTVSTPSITTRLCGASRPGHFDGVTTVVSKLFNLVGPDIAYFGEKDFQQLATIRKMSIDLNFPIEIIGVPIVRSSDNLALSSRNGYLSEEQRASAPNIYSVLKTCEQSVLLGKKEHRALENECKHLLSDKGFRVDYFEICQADSLLPSTSADKSLVILVAAYLGDTRLIDNMPLTLK